MALKTIGDFREIEIGFAADMTKAWQEKYLLKAFLFHENDITCLENESNDEQKVIGVRFYMGIEKGSNGEEPDMMVVGVDEHHLDIITRTAETEEETVSGIYNFALPCPRLCDKESDLFWGIDSGTTSYESVITKTPYDATTSDCQIEKYSITNEVAIKRVTEWQCVKNNELKSIYFDINDLKAIFNELGNPDAVRIYFALEDEAHRVILIGCKKSDTVSDLYEDFDTEYVYINTAAPCTGNGELSCDITSELYRNCE
ncbi:hypothetical protein [uncultured Kordia sp.]|uniref:hypothetical protein n=1 Tax=uncultured Kordia sp. TaxID=507699 RepID=UPI00261439AC|nr:hypothetical protein [uncultured Kordia sp.]